MRRINIAIDGPSSSGKSTIAKLIAIKFSYVHINTGLMYRAIAWNLLQKKISINNEADVKNSFNISDIKLNTKEEVFFKNINITSKIREDNVSLGASAVSKYKSIRKLCVASQQKMAKEKGIIMDGRDIGSVVLPKAELKIFMVASAIVRAKRRVSQNIELGFKEDFKEVLDEIKSRDYEDTHRENSPLIKVVDAIEIDTSDMTINDVVQKISNLVTAIISK